MDKRIVWLLQMYLVKTVFSKTACVLLPLIVAVIFLALSVIGWAVLVFGKSDCISNVRLLGTAYAMYSQDYDERLPFTAHWSESLEPYVWPQVRSETTGRWDPFHCPAAKSPASYGMNGRLNGISVSKLENTEELAQIFEAGATLRSFSGDKQNVARTRHLDSSVIGFADSHVKLYKAELLDGLIWEPVYRKEKPESSK